MIIIIIINTNEYMQKGDFPLPAIDTISALRSFRLFQSLTREELSTVAELCIFKKYRRGDHVFFQSEEISHVLLQLQGRVRLYSMSESGNEHTFMIAVPGDLFPHVGFFRTGNYPYHAVSIGNSICLAISVASFEQLLIAHPSIHFKITQVLADKVLELQRRLEDKTFYTLEGQLISLLLRLAQSHGCKSKAESHICVPLTNGELAGLLGTTRETVNRTINKLKKHQAVVVTEDGKLKVCVKRLFEMLPQATGKIINSDKWQSIRHQSDQCCISGGHEI